MDELNKAGKIGVSITRSLGDEEQPPPIPPHSHNHVSTPVPSSELYSRFIYPYRRSKLSNEDLRLRRKRTLLCIIVGIIILFASAALVSLLIHFLIIEKDHTNLKQDYIANKSAVEDASEEAVTTNNYSSTPPTVLPSSTTAATIINTTYILQSTSLIPSDTTSTTPRGIIELDTVKPVVSPPVVQPSTSIPKPPSLSLEIGRTAVGETLEINCTLTYAGEWGTITIMQTEPGNLNLLSTLHSASASTIDMLSVTSYFTQDNHTVSIYVEKPNASCADAGEYKCRLMYMGSKSFFKASQAQIVGDKLTTPKIMLPVTMVKNTKVKIEAEWTLSLYDTVESVLWQMRFPNETRFVTIPVIDTNHPAVYANCSLVFTNSFNVTLNDNWQNTVLRINVTWKNPQNILQSAISDVEYILLLPENICEGTTNGTLVAHPDQLCAEYIECSDSGISLQSCPAGWCFDETSKRCYENVAPIPLLPIDLDMSAPFT